jgi:hypothetical protein
MKNLLLLTCCFSILVIALSVGYYYVLYLPQREKAATEQQRILSEEKRNKERLQDEQRNKEYVAKRKAECYDIYERERKQFNNVEGNFYDKENDECVVRYTTDEYKGVDCQKEYKDIPSLNLECRLGIFTKRF